MGPNNPIENVVILAQWPKLAIFITEI